MESGSFHVACDLTKLLICRCDQGGAVAGRDATPEEDDDSSWGGRRVWMPNPQMMETIHRHAAHGAAVGLVPSARDEKVEPGGASATARAENSQAKAMMSGEEARLGYVKEFGVSGALEELDQDDGVDGGDAAPGADDRQSGSEDEDAARHEEDLSDEDK